MINYNNFNYLYNKNGKTVAVKSNTAEGQKMQGANAASGSGAASGASSVSGSSAAYSSGASNSSAASYEWIMLDNVNLRDCITVEEFSVNQVVTLFSDGNLTVPELRQWFKSNGVQGATVKNTNGTYDVQFEYNGKKYNLSCTFENARYQTDDKRTGTSDGSTVNASNASGSYSYPKTVNSSSGSGADSKSINNASGVNKQSSGTKFGSGIWTPSTLKQAKLSSEEIKKYFEAVNANSNYLRFNVEVIKATFPDKTINTPEQLKAAIEENASLNPSTVAENKDNTITVESLRTYVQQLWNNHNFMASFNSKSSFDANINNLIDKFEKQELTEKEFKNLANVELVFAQLSSEIAFQQSGYFDSPSWFGDKGLSTNDLIEILRADKDIAGFDVETNGLNGLKELVKEKAQVIDNGEEGAIKNDEPEAPKEPEVPVEPETPKEPEVPEEPEAPKEPEASVEPEVTVEPEVSDNQEGDNVKASENSIDIKSIVGEELYNKSFPVLFGKMRQNDSLLRAINVTLGATLNDYVKTKLNPEIAKISETLVNNILYNEDNEIFDFDSTARDPKALEDFLNSYLDKVNKNIDLMNKTYDTVSRQSSSAYNGRLGKMMSFVSSNIDFFNEIPDEYYDEACINMYNLGYDYDIKLGGIKKLVDNGYSFDVSLSKAKGIIYTLKSPSGKIITAYLDQLGGKIQELMMDCYKETFGEELTVTKYYHAGQKLLDNSAHHEALKNNNIISIGRTISDILRLDYGYDIYLSQNIGLTIINKYNAIRMNEKSYYDAVHDRYVMTDSTPSAKNGDTFNLYQLIDEVNELIKNSENYVVANPNENFNTIYNDSNIQEMIKTTFSGKVSETNIKKVFEKIYNKMAQYTDADNIKAIFYRTLDRNASYVFDVLGSTDTYTFRWLRDTTVDEFVEYAKLFGYESMDSDIFNIIKVYSDNFALKFSDGTIYDRSNPLSYLFTKGEFINDAIAIGTSIKTIFKNEENRNIITEKLLNLSMEDCLKILNDVKSKIMDNSTISQIDKESYAYDFVIARIKQLQNEELTREERLLMAAYDK